MRQGVTPDNDPFFPSFVSHPPERGRHNEERPVPVHVESACGEVQTLLKGGDVLGALLKVSPIVRAHPSRIPNGLLREVYVAALALRPGTRYAKRIVYGMLNGLAERLAEITSSHGIPSLFSVTIANGYKRIAKKRFAN